jgi:hypothetical protein
MFVCLSACNLQNKTDTEFPLKVFRFRFAEISVSTGSYVYVR